MINIYSGEFLEINYDQKKSIFIQKWINIKNLTLEGFRSEMLAYTKLYEVKRPKNSVWDQQEFNLNLSPDDFEWIEMNVNIPCLEYGNEKCAFIVGQDVLAHIAVMDSFEETKSCITPRHFGSMNDALDWISEKDSAVEDSFNVSFKGQKSDGTNEFLIQTTSGNIKNVLKDIKNIKIKEDFIKENIDKYLSLTPKELEIFKLYSKGDQLKSIAGDLFISEFTIRTHWRNVKKKLDIKSIADIQMYAAAFVK